MLFLSHQATGGCYASTVKPFQVALVKPVVYLKTELGSRASKIFPLFSAGNIKHIQIP
jgi:hypothetical protein